MLCPDASRHGRCGRDVGLGVAPRLAVRSWTDGDTVIHLGDAWCPPGRMLRFLAFSPGAHGAPEDHFAAVCLDGYAIGINFGVAPEGILDLGLDFRWRNAGLEEDQIADPLDAPDTAHGLLGARALVVPFHCSLERDPGVLHDDLYVL